MMKKGFLSLVALVVATMSYAQSTLVATLSHGDDITMYYGSYALRDVVNAAESGDVINLSGGAFQAVDITKAITLRGTGIDDDYPTYIVNNLTINISDEDKGKLSLEGVRFNGHCYIKGLLNNATFQKCYFQYLSCEKSEEYIRKSLIVNCWLKEIYVIGVDFSFINCYVEKVYTNYTSFINCVIDAKNWTSWYNNSQFINCIIIGTYSSKYPEYSPLPSSTVATNCISINCPNMFSGSPSNTGCVYSSYGEVFANGDTYELTDEAKAKFLGTDGTEVGMYGGMMPYTSTPSYPQITKMNVANKTTADGKLSVEIEVSAAE